MDRDDQDRNFNPSVRPYGRSDAVLPGDQDVGDDRPHSQDLGHDDDGDDDGFVDDAIDDAPLAHRADDPTACESTHAHPPAAARHHSYRPSNAAAGSSSTTGLTGKVRRMAIEDMKDIHPDDRETCPDPGPGMMWVLKPIYKSASAKAFMLKCGIKDWPAPAEKNRQWLPNCPRISERLWSFRYMRVPIDPPTPQPPQPEPIPARPRTHSTDSEISSTDSDATCSTTTGTDSSVSPPPSPPPPSRGHPSSSDSAGCKKRGRNSAENQAPAPPKVGKDTDPQTSPSVPAVPQRRRTKLPPAGHLQMGVVTAACAGQQGHAAPPPPHERAPVYAKGQVVETIVRDESVAWGVATGSPGMVAFGAWSGGAVVGHDFGQQDHDLHQHVQQQPHEERAAIQIESVPSSMIEDMAMGEEGRGIIDLEKINIAGQNE